MTSKLGDIGEEDIARYGDTRSTEVMQMNVSAWPPLCHTAALTGLCLCLCVQLSDSADINDVHDDTTRVATFAAAYPTSHVAFSAGNVRRDRVRT